MQYKTGFESSLTRSMTLMKSMDLMYGFYPLQQPGKIRIKQQKSVYLVEYTLYTLPSTLSTFNFQL